MKGDRFMELKPFGQIAMEYIRDDFQTKRTAGSIAGLP
jgi:hypothetical protein